MKEWVLIETPPMNDGWYLVTWQSPTGERFVDYSQFTRDFGFEDRWGSNAEAVTSAAFP